MEAESGHSVHVYSFIASVNFTTKIESTFVSEFTFTQASEISFSKLSMCIMLLRKREQSVPGQLIGKRLGSPFAHVQFQHPRMWVWFWMLKVKGQCLIIL